MEGYRSYNVSFRLSSYVLFNRLTSFFFFLSFLREARAGPSGSWAAGDWLGGTLADYSRTGRLKVEEVASNEGLGLRRRTTKEVDVCQPCVFL